MGAQGPTGPGAERGSDPPRDDPAAVDRVLGASPPIDGPAQSRRPSPDLTRTSPAGSGGETRTHNPLINSQMLCRLSYPGKRARPRLVDPGDGAGVPEEISRSPCPRESQVHGIANRAMMAAVKLRIAAAAAIVTGFVLGIVRIRRTRLRVVTPDGTTVRPRSRRYPIGPRGQGPGRRRAQPSVRARDALGVLGGWRDGEEATDALVVEMTGDLAAAINERSSLAG